MTARRTVSLIAALALTAAACTGREGQTSQASHGALPPVVVAAEGLAEDIQTDVDTRAWTAAQAKLAQLQESRSALRAAVLGDGTARIARYESALDSLAAQIGRQDRLASLESANRMSRVLLAVAAGYDPTVPVQVGLLDVTGRDALYGAESGAWQEVSASAAEFRAQFAAVQAHVAAKDTALNRRITQRLTALDAAVSARNAPRVRKAAIGLLGDVDLVERTY